MSDIFDGKQLSATIKADLKAKIDHLPILQRKPKLCVVLVGQDEASKTYVASKARACALIGFESETLSFEETITEQALLKEIERLNKDKTVDGILVQLPLPAHLNPERITHAVVVDKDVDGFHPENVGYLHIKQEGFVPCTPLGIMTLVKYYHIDLQGKHVVVIGRSNLVGRPIAQLMLNENATVTIAHSKTQHIEDLIKQADVVVAAVGIPHFVKAEWVKDKAILIDVGIHRINGKITGDIDPVAFDKASYYTPVPGGVGPMTIACLLENTYKAFVRHEGGTTWE